MSDLTATPCVLVVADRERVGEIVAALSELPNVELVVSSGGDDTIELFAVRRPSVVVVTASLHTGDTKTLIVTLRGRVPRGEVAVVVIGDDAGPVRTALDALDLAADRFVTRPLSSRALRFAVTGGIDSVELVRSAGPVPPRRRSAPMPGVLSLTDTQPGGTPPPRLPHAPLPPGAVSSAVSSVGSGAVRAAMPDAPSRPVPAPVEAAGEVARADTRAALRARWEALADSMVGLLPDDDPDQPAPPPSSDPAPVVAPQREPTLILREPAAAAGAAAEPVPVAAPAPVPDTAPASAPDAVSRTSTGDGHVVVAARTTSDERWSEPLAISALVDRDPRSGMTEVAPERELEATRAPGDAGGDLHAPGDAPGDDLQVSDELSDELSDDLFGEVTARREVPRQRPTPAPTATEASADPAPPPPPGPGADEPRDFARELRAKMSMMAQRLFQGSDAPAGSPGDHAPRHDHHTEIDLAALGDEPALAGVTDLEARGQRHEPRELATSPGSSGTWDTQVRERGLADAGAIVRGASDAAMLLAKMFAQGATGRIGFRRDEVETIVYFDRGRPVFASSNEPRDRMGELLLREGKITASQLERCQAVVAESGRRMGEILVDFGYLKRRELLPAVRRHVEDLVYSLFGWDRGSYTIAIDAQPSAERIRLSRHPASLILEGIRRKLDRTNLERLIGLPSTVIEVRDRDRLGGIVNLGDLAAEERAALAAFDGQADLAQVARTAGVDIADVLPLAWGLCVLGLATARRSDAEQSDEATALVGETDLAIDRERVHARWQLVSEADYFALLGVRRDATGFEIRRAYQSARRDFAADCFPSDLRRELARELDDIAHVLDEAFRVLRDDRLRQTYLANLVDR
ncbi:MAG: DUF4388 domain-containing protein [Deltaproteobacteria bacterium]|nr:MAG: DUF4388 domain-containing protein [Deltaproteobacteria bacterium]